MDDRLRSALDALNRHATDPASINGYLQVIVHLRKLAVNSTTPELARSAVLMTCLLGQVHESSQLLGDLLKTPGVLSDTELLEFLNIHVQNFPGEYSTRVLRADLYIKMGKPKEAIADYEVVCDNPIVCKPAHVATLLDLYKQQLNASSSPEIKFRIVKLFLHSKRYDDAIALLQPMTRSSQLRERATKVLALCFWRKGMHYLAWQRLQELPTSEDVKDLLYRLAVDMQQSDQSINALAVFKFLADTDPHYKDVKNRLPVLEELVKNMSERRGPGLTQRPNAEYSPGKSGNSGGINPAFTRQSQGIMEALKDSRFTPLEEINRGSMGIVFRARDKVLDELVALKILSDYLAYDESAVERFKREARAAKRLSHPNIVRIHDMYEIGGKRLLSMEYIDGMDVKNILVRDRIMPIDQVISTARGVCHALEYAHQMGIVHRDIKPANIMVCPSGLVKVTDFGIAKFLNQQSLQDASGTQTMGTPLYMSPEQVRGDTVDYRTDIYSLGITLFEMLTGRPPFYEGNIEYHHLYSKPKAITREDIPAELTALTLKCLEKDPNNRFQTITEVRQALVNIQKIQ